MLTIYGQKDSLGVIEESNRLLTLSRPIYLAMHLCSLKETPARILPPVRVPGSRLEPCR
ncbi:MAG: hypothetical protein WCA08_13465 [Desulfoferrobacter sp.]